MSNNLEECSIFQILAIHSFIHSFTHSLTHSLIHILYYDILSKHNGSQWLNDFQ